MNRAGAAACRSLIGRGFPATCTMSSQQKAKKPRCRSGEKRQRRAEKWNAMSPSKQQQVRIDTKIALATEQQTLAAAQQQLDVDRKDLDDKTAELQHTSRAKFREAEARKAQAQREWAWAHNLVHSELNDGKLSRALSLEACGHWLRQFAGCSSRRSCQGCKGCHQ